MDYFGLYIATALLYAITFILATVLLLRSLCDVRKRDDSVRKAFPWLNAAILFYAVATCFFTVEIVLQILIFYDYNISANVYLAFQAISQTSIVVVDALIFLVILRIGSGILLVQFGEKLKSQVVFGRSAYVGAAVLVPLAVAKTALSLTYSLKYYKGDSKPYLMMSAYWVTVALRTATLFLALLALARTVHIARKCRPEPRVQQGPKLLLASSLFWLVRALYGAVSIATIERLYVSSRNDTPRIISPNYEYYSIITEFIFWILPVYIVLHSIFAMGARQQNGLWSTPPLHQ